MRRGHGTKLRRPANRQKSAAPRRNRTAPVLQRSFAFASLTAFHNGNQLAPWLAREPASSRKMEWRCLRCWAGYLRVDRKAASHSPNCARSISTVTGRDGFRCRLSNVLLALLCIVVPTSGCGSSEEVEEGARDRAKSERIRDSHERIGRRPSRAATNAEPARLMPGIGRPCEEAKDFDHYFLGNSFEGLPLTGKDRHCSPPPRKVRDENGTLVYMKPGRINTYGYVYGRCAPPQDPKTGHV